MTADVRPWGSVRPRGPSWEGRVPKGEPRSRTFPDQATAAAWVEGQRLLFDPRAVLDRSPVRMTVVQLLDLYHDTVGPRRRWTEQTISKYRTLTSHVAADPISKLAIDEVRAFDLTRLISRLETKQRARGSGCLGRTVRDTVKHVAEALRWAAAQDLIDRAPGPVDLPPAVARDVALDEDELADYLILSEGHWLHLPIACAVLAGLRLREIYGRRRADFDMAAGVIEIKTQGDGRRGGRRPKGTVGQRLVVMPWLLVEILTREFARQDASPFLSVETVEWLMVHPNGQPRSAGSLWKAYDRLLSGLPIRPVHLHDLRHTYATEVAGEVQLEESRRAMAAQLGHSSFETARRVYIHPSLLAQARLAAVLDARIRQTLDRRRAFWAELGWATDGQNPAS
jgi:integrase